MNQAEHGGSLTIHGFPKMASQNVEMYLLDKSAGLYLLNLRGGAILQKPVVRMPCSVVLFVIESPQAVNTAATVYTRGPFFLLSHVNN